MMHAMLRQPIFARLAALCTLAWPMGAALANTQLDQIEVLVAKQRAQQEQLGQLLKITQAEAGRDASWAMPAMPELATQSVLLSVAAVAAVIMICTMLWLWKNRMPASVAYRPVPEPRVKESAFSGLQTQDSAFKTSAFKTSAFKTSAFKNSSFKDALPEPAAFKTSLQDSSWTESWAADTSPLAGDAQKSKAPAPDPTPASEFSAGEQPDISLDDLESGFAPSVMDFDLSDFDHIASDEPFATDATAQNSQPDVSLPNSQEPASPVAVPELAPLTEADFELMLPIEPDSEDFTDSTAVFIAGEVDHRESAFDLLKFDTNAPAVGQNVPVAAGPIPRASGKIDSEVPSKYDQLPAQTLRPEVAYIAPIVKSNSPAAFSSESAADIEFSGSAFGQLQHPVPDAILPYPHPLDDDDAPFATQLDLARECAELGQIDEAEQLCQEVFTNGTEPMREYALYILTRLPEFKRKHNSKY
jgi:FimV-like protein